MEPSAIPHDGEPIELIIGYFDPVWAATVERLRGLCRTGATTVVAVDHPAEPLLAWRARAELVAALDCVDFVIDAANAADLTPAGIIDDRQSDAERSARLAQQILDRHRSE